MDSWFIPSDVFWIKLKSEYPLISDKAIEILLPFSTIYFCELSFSTIVLVPQILEKTLEKQICIW